MMKIKYLALVVLSSALLGACASKPSKNDSSPAPAAKVEGEIVGKPAPGSKFSKLKIGMPLKQVVATIGAPTKEWSHPTGKVSIPFYFGPDRWVIQYSYKGEGLLTLNSGEEQLLTKIEVNKAE
jgi:hypothetical protein